MDALKSISGATLGFLAIIAIVVVLGLLLAFGANLAFAIAPAVYWLSGAVLLLDIISLLFMGIPRARNVVGVMLFISSYIFGLSTWIYGLAVTLSLWGWLAVIIGVFMGGVGVVPIGMLAAIFHGRWDIFATLLITLLLTYGTRLLGTYLVEKAEEQREVIRSDDNNEDERAWRDIA